MDILMNEQVQQALVALVVVALTAAARWIQSQISQTAILNDNWCYVQPVVESVLNAAARAIAEGNMTGGAAGQIVAKGVAEFVATYRKFEGKEPSKAQLKAVSAELERAAGAVAK